MDGQVIHITTKAGQTVIAAEMAPTILKLADLTAMTVKIQVSEADIVHIYPGQSVYFSILGEPDKKYEGKLSSIEPYPEKINDTIFYNVLFDIPNLHHTFRLDMTAQVSIVLAQAKKVLTIPSWALGAKQGEYYQVRVLNKNGSVSTRQIKIGLKNNIRVEVTDGLEENEQVVIKQKSDTSEI
jgi:macrolide-specific efflux system membrane fusion protein